MNFRHRWKMEISKRYSQKEKKKEIIQFSFEKNFVLEKEDRDIGDNRRSSEGKKKKKAKSGKYET